MAIFIYKTAILFVPWKENSAPKVDETTWRIILEKFSFYYIFPSAGALFLLAGRVFLENQINRNIFLAVGTFFTTEANW